MVNCEKKKCQKKAAIGKKKKMKKRLELVTVRKNIPVSQELIGL